MASGAAAVKRRETVGRIPLRQATTSRRARLHRLVLQARIGNQPYRRRPITAEPHLRIRFQLRRLALVSMRRVSRKPR